MSSGIKILVNFLIIASLLAILADVLELVLGNPPTNVFSTFVNSIVTFVTTIPNTILTFILDMIYATINIALAIVWEILPLSGSAPTVP